MVSIFELEKEFAKCADWSLHPDYISLTKDLDTVELSEPLVTYLREKASSKKHWCEIRFYHLRILLLNKSTTNFDLKQYFYDRQKSSRRLWLKLFYIRGYAMYANEQEMIPIVYKFQSLLMKCHDYVDYEPILSVGGLPYLVKTYRYTCLKEALVTAQNEYLKINPLLRGEYTLDEQLEFYTLMIEEERHERFQKWLEEKNT